MPANVEWAHILSNSCTDEFCIAIGSFGFNSEDVNPEPLILKSRDKGKSWAVINKISGYPAHVVSGIPTSLKCHDHTCMGVGGYELDKDQNIAPLLMISQDSGESWTYSNAGSVDLMSKKSGYLLDFANSGSTWIGVGHYAYPSHPPLPDLELVRFLMVSHDNGLTWNEENIEGGPALPPREGVLDAINCQNNICLVFGNGESAPFIARSEDNGDHWTTINNFSWKPPRLKHSYPWKATCKDNLCVVTGIAIDWHDDEPPLIWVSHDHGLSWSQPDMHNIPADHPISELTQVSCANEKFCAMIARSEPRLQPEFAALLTTQDGGISWNYQENSFIEPHSVFDAIQCTNESCYVLGENETSWYPFILTSIDQAQTWTAQTEIIGLPDHYFWLKSFLDGQAGLIHHSMLAQANKYSLSRMINAHSAKKALQN